MAKKPQLIKPPGTQEAPPFEPEMAEDGAPAFSIMFAFAAEHDARFMVSIRGCDLGQMHAARDFLDQHVRRAEHDIWHMQAAQAMQEAGAFGEVQRLLQTKQ